MTTVYDDLRTLLSEHTGQDDLTRPPQLLQLAFSWCAETLAPPAWETLNRADLLAVVVAVLKAVHQGQVFLRTVIPQALNHAVAGTRLCEAFAEGEAAFAQGARELDQLRNELTSLLQQEQTLRAQAAEYAALQDRRAELERLARLVPHIPELSRQVEELAQRLPTAGQEAAEQEQQLERIARSFICLSQDTLAEVTTHTRQALEVAERMEQERQEAENQLCEARARQQQAEADLQKLTLRLRPHCEADRVIAQAIPAADKTQDIFQEVERLLQQADEALRHTLQTHAEAQTLDKLYLTGEAARHDRSV